MSCHRVCFSAVCFLFIWPIVYETFLLFFRIDVIFSDIPVKSNPIHVALELYSFNGLFIPFEKKIIFSSLHCDL